MVITVRYQKRNNCIASSFLGLKFIKKISPNYVSLTEKEYNCKSPNFLGLKISRIIWSLIPSTLIQNQKSKVSNTNQKAVSNFFTGKKFEKFELNFETKISRFNLKRTFWNLVKRHCVLGIYCLGKIILVQLNFCRKLTKNSCWKFFIRYFVQSEWLRKYLVKSLNNAYCSTLVLIPNMYLHINSKWEPFS